MIIIVSETSIITIQYILIKTFYLMRDNKEEKGENKMENVWTY